MAHSTARTFIEPFLTFSSYVRVRIFVPLAVYFPLSLSYAMVSLPFKLPFGAKYAPHPCLNRSLRTSEGWYDDLHDVYRYNYATGFFAFFAFIYMGMCALGLALEAMITLLTLRFVPFFLVLLVCASFSHMWSVGIQVGIKD